MDPPSRLPTFWEAMIGAAVAFVVALVLFAFETPAAIAPLLCGAALLGYGLLNGLGWLIRRVFRT